MLLTRMRAVFLISTVWAGGWLVLGLALGGRLVVFENGAPISRVLWLIWMVGRRSANIGFVCGAVFSTALLVLGARGVRHLSIRLGGPLAAALVGAFVSGRLELEPFALTAVLCGSCAAACAVASLAIATGERQPITSRQSRRNPNTR